MASGVAGDNKVVQQLVFENSEMTGARDRDEVEVGERGGRKRLEQLATQVEDLNYQVSMLNEELEDRQKQLETFQVTLDFCFFCFLWDDVLKSDIVWYHLPGTWGRYMTKHAC